MRVLPVLLSRTKEEMGGCVPLADLCLLRLSTMLSSKKFGTELARRTATQVCNASPRCRDRLGTLAKVSIPRDQILQVSGPDTTEN